MITLKHQLLLVLVTFALFAIILPDVLDEIPNSHIAPNTKTILPPKPLAPKQDKISLKPAFTTAMLQPTN